MSRGLGAAASVWRREVRRVQNTAVREGLAWPGGFRKLSYTVTLSSVRYLVRAGVPMLELELGAEREKHLVYFI
jgi:hypothetical protein